MPERILNLNIQDISLEILTNENVFLPSPHGSKALAEFIKVNKGDKVIDIGCGTGFLAILSAKKGGFVKGTDILQEAVNLSNKNALKNKVNVDFRKGDLFSPFEEEKFDVIIANVPQEVLSPKIKKKWDKNKIISYSGGETGSEILIRTLEEAKKYMHKKSRLYIVVYAMSNYRESLKCILKNYSAKLVNFYSSPVKEFVYEDREWYEQNTKVQIYEKGDEIFSDLFTFELSLKS
jgi:HemK-related putative methylase